MVSFSKQGEQGLGGSSKQRREQIKSGIDMLKKVLPLTKQDIDNLSQLQTLHAACTYIRKVASFNNLPINYQNDDYRYIHNGLQTMFSSQLGLSETMFGFVIVLTKDRHLIYVSDNVVDYLGLKSTEVLLSCETFEDVLHPVDEKPVTDIFKSGTGRHEFYCSWNASKIKRRVHTKADAKIIKINGHFISNGNLFVATCVPMLRSMNRDYLVATSPTCFTTVHSLDLRILEVCEKGQNLLKYEDSQYLNTSLYELVHANDLDLIKRRHKNLLNTKSQKGKVDTIQVLRADGTFVHCLVNMYYCVNSFIICKYQVLSEAESISYNNYMNELNVYISKGIPQLDGPHCSDDLDQDASPEPSPDNSQDDEDEYEEPIPSVKPARSRGSKRSYTQISDKDESSHDSFTSYNSNSNNVATIFDFNEIKKCKRASVDSIVSNNSSLLDQSISKPVFENSFETNNGCIYGVQFPATPEQKFIVQDVLHQTVDSSMYPQQQQNQQFYLQQFQQQMQVLSCNTAFYTNYEDFSPISSCNSNSNSAFDFLPYENESLCFNFDPSITCTDNFVSFMNNDQGVNNIDDQLLNDITEVIGQQEQQQQYQYQPQVVC